MLQFTKKSQNLIKCLALADFSFRVQGISLLPLLSMGHPNITYCDGSLIYNFFCGPGEMSPIPPSSSQLMTRFSGGSTYFGPVEIWARRAPNICAKIF
jgi:hypothetical protein